MPLPHEVPVAGRQFLPVWCGCGLGTWSRLIALGPPMHPSRLGRILGVTAAAGVNSVLNLLERAVFGRRVAAVPLDHAPLFILGHWRSGTTLLHNLLARDPQFVAPTTYQVSFPGHFLLTERMVTRLTAALVPDRRPTDEMPFGWDLPGEDEIALLVTTLLSPYLDVAFPKGSAQVQRLDDFRRNLSAEELSRWKAALVGLVRKISLRARRIPLLKSPPHTGRIPLLLELFPDARFVYVVRNPYGVFASTRHLRRVLTEANTLGRCTSADLDEKVLTTYARLYDAYHLHRALVPAGRRHELRFEDLTADPVGALSALYSALGLGGFEMLRAAVEPDLRSLRAHRTNRYELDAETRARIYDRWRPAFRRYGYRQ